MRQFEPIAVVGRGCVLPGALTPDALWDSIASGRSLLGRTPTGRWGVPPSLARCDGPADSADRAWSDWGGYVDGFEGDPAFAHLDPVFQWTLDAARQALASAGHEGSSERVTAIFGNLSFPSRSLALYAESLWLKGLPGAPEAPHPRNRFMSGGPAELLVEALGLGEAYALDAACASSLYALKLACDRLHDGRADLALAGAVNAADDLFIHVGFSALSALSLTSQSRPFHKDADGLLPAEGAAFLALKRLDDAVAAGDRILGVIRGVGLSNDGRGRGFLAPSAEGQVRAMRAAYAQCDLTPADISLIECHATGTSVGDATEIRSMSEVFSGAEGLPIGSLKSNLGHGITTAGAAALLKVLGALEADTRPATLGVEEPLDDLATSPFRVLNAAEAWNAEAPRVAGINAFGFGGNNAHVLLQEWTGAGPAGAATPAPVAGELAVVGIGARVGNGGDAADLAEVLRGDRRAEARAAEVTLNAEGLRFPPKDLQQTHAQQLMMLAAAIEAAEDAGGVPASTGVFVGAQCDPEVARYGARWRLRGRLAGDDPAWVDAVCDALVPTLESPGVVGTMPNIPANRLNSQFDAIGPGFTVAGEGRSGLVALDIGMRALRAGEVDAALVGAVDLSCEPVHVAASGASDPGDAAVALVIRRLEDAREAGERVYAVLRDVPDEAPTLDPDFGDAHAARALVAVAATIIDLHEGRGAPTPWLGAGDSGAVAPRPAAARVLTFPAHPSEVAMPARPAQVMTPPPALDPVVGLDQGAPETTEAPAPRAPSPPPSPEARRPAVAPPSPSPRPTARPIAAAPPEARPTADHGPAAHATQAHHDYLALQARMHEEFMQMRGRMLERLRSGHQAPAPAPETRPLAPPAQPVVQVAPATAAQAQTRQHAPTPKPTPAPPRVPADLAPAPVASIPARSFPGPSFDRAQLEVFSKGRVSDVYGPLFEQQDGYRRQVRMPTPPLLLADRVLGIDGEAGSMAPRATIWTETDVVEGAWYLNEGFMPTGVMIESGQADLMLISWLGVDFLNKGERVYRLLGCELTFHGGLPKVGETLEYEIHCDGHAAQGDIRLFFFHYDCVIGGKPRLSVRHGQAGFFTDEELADSGGILWSPDEAQPSADGRVERGPALSERRSLTRAQLEAWAGGDALTAFGPGFELTQPHTRTPSIQADDMLLMHRVTDLDPQGGPWGRGYLRAEWDFTPDDWFFDGHFHEDPCMPGTLMFEGCLQAMAAVLTSHGFTLDRDGWRFEPVQDVPYQLQCRGQATPTAKQLVYEVFVEEVWADDEPVLWADILCTVDGLKAFHAARVGLILTPDWPLDAMPELLAEARADALVKAPAAQTPDGFTFDLESLLACAWGRPSEAFGPMYEPFDGTRRVARLPGPPYHFMSRVTEVEGPIGGMKVGTTVEIEYDIPADAWYFDPATGVMPFCVLLEAALQPCGWLASYVGSALTTDIDLSFRNLDGTGTIHRELRPGDGPLKTRATITNISQSAGMIIESFDVRCTVLGEPVYDLKTVFGFFPKAALESQVGITPTDEERAELEAADGLVVDLREAPERYYGEGPILPAGNLRVLDRVVLHDPTGGEAGLGRCQSEMDVLHDQWFFKAHFFQDPVQPGSLGIEAMLQLLQFHMLHTGMAEGVDNPRFEPIARGREMTWKYRGQVIPTDAKVFTQLEITEAGVDDLGPYAVADAFLWVDDRRIYSAKGVAMRVLPGPPEGAAIEVSGERLSLDTHPWLGDHRPTWTLPALPLLSMADRLLDATGAPGLDELTVYTWAVPPTTLTVEAGSDGTTALLADGQVVARGRAAGAAQPAPNPLPPLLGPEAPDPYGAGTLFHGPAFQRLRALVVTDCGASALLDADCPREILLDAATHAIPHDDLRPWFANVPSDAAAYPLRIEGLHIWGSTPTGTVRCEARAAGMAGGLPRVDLQIIRGEEVWCAFSLVEVLVPKGPVGLADPADRLAFLRDRLPVPGLGLARMSDTETRLSADEIQASDWLPGTVAAAYALADGVDPLAHVAIKDHVGQRLGVHPAEVAIEGEGWARAASQPLTPWRVSTERQGDDLVVRDAPGRRVDLSSVLDHWDRWFDLGRWPVEDLFYGLIRRFVRQVRLEDPAAWEAWRGRSVVYLANHQVGIESLLFSIALSGLSGVNTVTLAKEEHRRSWLGDLIRQSFSWPGARDPGVITYFDRDDRESLPRIIGELAAELAGGAKSVMVHVEGTRSLECRTPVQKMSGAFIDMAIGAGAAVVPVRFAGALPVDALDDRIEFPFGLGGQDVHVGRPLPPEALAAMTYKDRKAAVLDAINGLGPAQAAETPIASDEAFAAAVQRWADESGVRHEDAVLRKILEEASEPSEHTALLLSTAELPPTPVGAWLGALRRRLGEP